MSRNHVSRRLYLATGVSIVLGGCLNDNNDDIPGLSNIYIRNERETEIELSTTVLKDDSIVYDGKIILEGEKDNSWGEATLEKPWLGESVPYEVVVDSPKIDKSNYRTEDFLDIGGDNNEISCFGLTIVIEESVVDFRPSPRKRCP